MSNFNNLSTGRQGNLTEVASHDQTLDIRNLLVAFQAALGQLDPNELATFKPLRRVVRAKAAIPMTGCGRSHFFALQNPKDPAWDPTFPHSIKLGDSPRSPTVWFVDLIEAWLEARAAASCKTAQKREMAIAAKEQGNA